MTSGVIDLFNRLAQNDFGFFQRVNSLSDMMTSDFKSLALDDTLGDAIECFATNQIHHAPVIDEGDVVGIISDRDLLRHHPPMLGTAAEGDKDHLALRTPVSQMLTRATIALPCDSTPLEALDRMLNHHIDSVLVQDANQKLQGIVTARDFMQMVNLFHHVCTRGPDLVRLRLVDLDVSKGLPLDVIFSRGARSIRDVMTKEIESVGEGDTIAKTIEIMQTRHVRHVPVVDDSNCLIGMLTDREILRFLPIPVPRQDPRSKPSFRRALFTVSDSKVFGERVSSIMDRNHATVHPEGLLLNGVKLLIGQTISGLPVVENDENILCGILTTTDILRVFRVILQISALVSAHERHDCFV